MNYTSYELTCNPLDTYSEVLMFLQQPPAWRSLCKELKPHSTRKIRNIESHQFDGVSRTTLDGPEAFCHVSPDADEDKRYDEKCLPKTLVCHDMANGYHDDCIIDGTGNYDAYTFYNWAGIDIFCYFSHHLITIPPLGWINVGHDHGVKVIGTVITEWADGIEFWEEVLETEEEYKNFANALVVIAKTLKFDGWLLNVENKIAKPDMLLEFVKHLHALLHQELADPVLIWYDSVTVEGHLNWQNALNHKNRAFFDACDGIFTNYSWTEEDVESSAREAGDRVRDLFIGIDVWGRNFYGGGQFNVQEAVEVAALQGCSLAVFAPAWTHEALSLQQSDVNAVALCDLPAYQHFLLRDRALWDSVWRYLATRLPCRLPFATSFCRGQGLTRRLYGEVICPVPWYNLRHMQYQPNTSHGPHGYLLSTIENIATASRTGILKDPNGIIKYRASMLENKLEEDEAPPEKAEDDADDAPAGLVPRADSTGELPAAADHADQADDADADHSAEGVESKPSKISLKRKMKNVFKHIFHRKNDYDAQQAAETGDRSKAPEWRVLEPIPEQSSEPELGPSKTANGRDPDPASGGKVDLDAGKPTTETDAEPSEPSRRKKQKPEFDEAVKVAEGEEARADETDEEATGEDAPAVLHGRSMVQMSVQLKLKAKDARTRFGLASVPDERQCLEVHLDDAFIGGSCLKVNPSDEHSREHRTVRLLQCEFPCEARLVFCVVTKKVVGHEEQFLNVDVHLRERGAAEDRVVLVGRDVAQAAAAHAPGFIAHVAPVGAADPRHLRDLQRYILLNEPGFYIPIENSYNWTVRYYEVDLPGAVVTSINLATGLSSGPILLGYFGICARRSDGDND